MTSLTIPAADLGLADDQQPAAALYGYTFGRIRMSGPRKWVRPKFDGATAKNRRQVKRNPAVAGEKVRFESVPTWPARVPWRMDWQPGEGTDNACIIGDPANGVTWECQNLRYENPFDPASSPLVVDNLHMRTPDCEIDEPHMSRGCGGVPSEAGLLTAEKMASGITEALALFNVNTQYGPGARIVDPAGRLEHTRVSDRSMLGLRPGNVPENVPAGSRFIVDRTDDEIDELAWRNAPEPSSGTAAKATAAARRASLINLYVGLRDYGMANLATASGTTYIETEGCQRANGTDVAWARLGFTTDADFRTALTGLIGPGTLKVVRPA